jgi:hypothetical protein
MTAVSAIHEISVEDIPVNAGIGVTSRPSGKAMCHIHVDTKYAADTLNLNTYLPGTVEEIEGIPYYSINAIAYPGTSVTWSGSTLTFSEHIVDGTSAQIKCGAIAKLGN